MLRFLKGWYGSKPYYNYVKLLKLITLKVTSILEDVLLTILYLLQRRIKLAGTVSLRSCSLLQTRIKLARNCFSFPHCKFSELFCFISDTRLGKVSELFVCMALLTKCRALLQCLFLSPQNVQVPASLCGISELVFHS